MSIIVNSPFKEYINNKTKKEIIDFAFDKKDLRVNVDKGWYDIHYREILVELFLKIFKDYCNNQKKNEIVIVSPDNLRLPFGLTPILSIVSYKLGINFAVWKELGNFSDYEDLLYGDIHKELNAYVVQDVLFHGGTLFRMANELNKTNWIVKKYLSLFSYKKDESNHGNTLDEIMNRLGKSNPELKFESIFTIDIEKDD